MPSVSDKQHRAMEAAAHGHSTLGIPAKVGQDFVAADAARGKVRKARGGTLGLLRPRMGTLGRVANPHYMGPTQPRMKTRPSALAVDPRLPQIPGARPAGRRQLGGTLLPALSRL